MSSIPRSVHLDAIALFQSLPFTVLQDASLYHDVFINFTNIIMNVCILDNDFGLNELQIVFI